MGLDDFRRSGSIEQDICIIMRAQGQVDRALAARKQWVRAFIKGVIPWWVQGERLSATEAGEVGARFSALLAWGKQHQYDKL